MPVSVTFAWMTIVLALPYLGAFLYLLIGENRLGEHRISRAKSVTEQSRQWRETLCQSAQSLNPAIPPIYTTLDLQASKVIGYPTLPGNQLKLLTDFNSTFQSLIKTLKTLVHYACWSSTYLKKVAWLMT